MLLSFAENNVDRPTGFLARLQTFHGRALGSLFIHSLMEALDTIKWAFAHPVPWVQRIGAVRIEELNQKKDTAHISGRLGCPSNHGAL
ncbi:MAG TPA: hypothetical protein VE999_09505 [Gemmataceae bacterium]|nr:hypothetical protein [Gemmataceae bacterium]